MALLLLSFFGGALTILSPCVLPLLPIIIGGSLTEKSRWRPVIITVSLSFSLVLFTLVLKWSTAFIAIPPKTWSYISGGLVIGLGLVTVFPGIWEHFANALKLSNRSNKLLAESGQKKGAIGAVLTGLALGPVFSSCSPTYALILATVLPASFAVGLVNLIAYALGLAVVLLLIAVFGQRVIEKLKWAANPDGAFKKVLGVVFVIVGLLIILGIDKQIETALVERGFGITALEERLVTDISTDMDDEMVEGDSFEEDGAPDLNVRIPSTAPELQGVTNWINSDPLTLEELEGKVVVLDFWTYSCINCVRTLPYLQDWHDKYADDGLVILGVHAPEFAFEKVPANVQNAVDEFELEYPIVLDNDFATWRAYSNRYWPAKYFIDREGNVRHTHFGEGEYEESEEVIRYLLAEGGEMPSEEVAKLGDENVPPVSRDQSPETYLGYKRVEAFVGGTDGESGLEQDVIADYSAAELETDEWTLHGSWLSEDERVVAEESGASLQMVVSGKSVYLVMSPADEGEIGDILDGKVEVLLNGELIPDAIAGEDIRDGVVTVTENKLYHLIEFNELRKHTEIELRATDGISMYAFTFGS